LGVRIDPSGSTKNPAIAATANISQSICCPAAKCALNLVPTQGIANTRQPQFGAVITGARYVSLESVPPVDDQIGRRRSRRPA